MVTERARGTPIKEKLNIGSLTGTSHTGVPGPVEKAQEKGSLKIVELMDRIKRINDQPVGRSTMIMKAQVQAMATQGAVLFC